MNIQEVLFSYYISLFSIEIAVFGIISAVILVYVQLVFSAFSYRHIGHILKNKWLILFFVFSALDLILTAIGIYVLAFSANNLNNPVYQIFISVITNYFYALACLILIFASITFFVILIAKNIKYLQPHRALFLIASQIKYHHLRDFLWKKYGLDIPHTAKLSIRYVLEIQGRVKTKDKQKEKEEVLKQEAEEEKKRSIAIKKGERIKLQVRDKEDPLEPLVEMIIRFIKNSDFRSLSDAKELLCKISFDFIKSLPTARDDVYWEPENNLLKNYVTHLIDVYDTLFEITDKEQSERAQKILLDSSFIICNYLYDAGRYREADRLWEYWRTVADKSLGNSASIFKLVIRYYDDFGDKLIHDLKNVKLEQKRELITMLDNIFRNFGWLGERLLIKVPLEKPTLIKSYEYSTEYDDLFNSIISFSYTYNKDLPNEYPLIYFDALQVILVKLIDIYKVNDDESIKNNIFSICYAFSSFADDAIGAKNSRGASLATMRLVQMYRELKKAGLQKQAKDCIELLLDIGLCAAGNKVNLKPVEFMKSIEEYTLEEIVKSGEYIRAEVEESYLKTMGGDHEGRWKYIKTLGMRMGTNFGFMFDASTGENYAENDPRRR